MEQAMTATEPARAGARVAAHGLSLRGARGWIYRDVDLAAEPGTLLAVQGVAGSGRTCLLLTLAGRMAPTDGSARIGNLPLPRQMSKIQRITALGVVAGVNDLDPALTVSDHMRERLLLHGRLGRRSRVRGALAAAGVGVDPATLVRDLDPYQRQLLGAALALVGSPQVLLVDDVDAGLSARAQRELWRALHRLSRDGVTVVGTCHEAGPAGEIADSIVALPHPTEPDTSEETDHASA